MMHDRDFRPQAYPAKRKSKAFRVRPIFGILLLLCLPAPGSAQPPVPDGPNRGREIYSVYCAGCHGPDGRGDGALAANLNPRPSNLVDGDTLVVHSDGELAAFILDGGASRHRGPMMPAWATVLSTQEAAEVVRYLRSLHGK